MNASQQTRRPTFAAVRECFADDHGITLHHDSLFPHGDQVVARFRGKTAKTQRETWALAEHEDDEEIEPDVVDAWCREFELDADRLSLLCEDGSMVSVKSGGGSKPPPPMHLAPPLSASSARAPRGRFSSIVARRPCALHRLALLAGRCRF